MAPISDFAFHSAAVSQLLALAKESFLLTLAAAAALVLPVTYASLRNLNGIVFRPMSTGLLVKRLSEAATLPVRGSLHAAGYDLASAQDVVVPARGKLVVLTDLAIAVPEGTYGRVAPRSGLAAKHHINLGAGVIDADYRGNVGVVMFNHADQDFHVKTGDRIAQLVLERIVTPEVEEVTELPDTVRGAGGFGSTGVESNQAKRKREE